MTEKLFVYDRSGALVNDPEDSLNYASGLSFGSDWPGGYGTLTCMVRRDILAAWAIKSAYRLIVRDGQVTVYDGRINSPARALQSGDESITLTASGWRCRLAERSLNKPWVDIQAAGRLEWPASATRTAQEMFVQDNPNEDSVQVRMGADDRTMDHYDQYSLEYAMPHGSYVRRITFDWQMRSGEGLTLDILNVDQFAVEWTYAATGSPGDDEPSGSVDLTLAEGDTRTIRFRFYPTLTPPATNTFDQNDWIRISNLVVYSETDLTQGAIIEDVLAACGEDLSVDYNQITDPGLTLNPFVTANNSFELALSVIERVLAYGDASLNAYRLSVWGGDDTSDGKPRVVVEINPDTADYEYVCRVADFETFEVDEAEDELFNWIEVLFEDAQEFMRHLTPVDDATLTDAASVAAYGRRDLPQAIDIGQATAALAAYVGGRHLSYHAWPLSRGTMTIKSPDENMPGTIRRRDGGLRPINQVPAGERVKVVDYRGGTVFVIGSTQYDADNQSLTMTPDLPPDDLETFFQQRERGLR